MSRWIAVALLAFCPCIVVWAQKQPDEVTRKIVVRSEPAYPKLAQRLNLAGIVKLRVTVAPDGTPKQANVVGGNPILAQSAQEAVSKWKWLPSPEQTIELVELRFHPF